VWTKDNIIKRKWAECKKCTFCDDDETVEHLFIRCKFAKLVWQVVHFTFSIPPPNIKNYLFANWLNGIDLKTKSGIQVGVCAILWSIWNSRNDAIFNIETTSQFLQVIHKAVHWMNMWSLLQAKDQQVYMDSGYSRFMTVIRAIFHQGGWQPSNMIQECNFVFLFCCWLIHAATLGEP
jgi:hypothetical protein